MKKLILLGIIAVILLSVGCSNAQEVDTSSNDVKSLSENSEVVVEKTGNTEEPEQEGTEIENQTEAETATEVEAETITEGEIETVTDVENKTENITKVDNSNNQQNTDSLENKDDKTPVFVENIIIDPIFSYNEEKVAIAVEKGFESPVSQIDRYDYTPKESDTINFTSEKDSLGLEESLKHKGFSGLEVIYDRTQYKWRDFSGDLDVTESKRNITVKLKGESIFETDILDDYQKFYRYFDENKGLYYEVSDFMVGNYLDENAELTNERTGNCANYNGIEGLQAPTYNPLVNQKGEEAINHYITVLNDKPCVYIETIFNENLHKKWIDIESGVLVKSLVFNNEGLIIEKKVATSLTKKDIDDSVFAEPRDIEFKDITLFVFSFVGGDVETIFFAFNALFPGGETGVVLTSDTGSQETIFTRGIDDVKLKDPIYYSKITLDSGDERTIREIKSDRFYTVCDELETVEIFDKSCHEKKFFNFEDVGLMDFKTVGDSTIYTFYDPNNISVSALYGVYEYVIENDEFSKINYYQVQNIAVNEPIRDVITYEISLIDFDEKVYDESYMDNYKIIDRGENSFDDGEYMPFWYQ